MRRLHVLISEFGSKGSRNSAVVTHVKTGYEELMGLEPSFLEWKCGLRFIK